MLARAHRLTSGEEFVTVLRRGRRAGSRTLVVHVLCGDDTQEAPVTRVGLVVGKAVGDAVCRNRVKRRLRHLVRQRVPVLPKGTVLVIRALPPAGDASSADLDADLGSTLDRVLRRGAAA